MSKKKVCLIITDGWGEGERDQTNPIMTAKLPNMEIIRSHYRGGALQASGIAVGLPWGEVGNSEVGHLTLGAGKILYQHYPRISIAIETGDFAKNPVLRETLTKARQSGRLHLIGLLSQGHVHASLEHLIQLIEVAGKEGGIEIYLHLFADGKDSAPRSFLELYERLLPTMQKHGARMGSIGGRVFGLDRDRHFDRTKEMYEAIIGNKKLVAEEGEERERIRTYIEAQYAQGLNDDQLLPAMFFMEGAVRAHDAVLFFNYREDSIRQIASCFSSTDLAGQSFYPDFVKEEKVEVILTTMTEYAVGITPLIIFPPERVEEPLGKVISRAGLNQLRIAETEKYAHVTYFFNGLTEAPEPNEYRVLIPSSSTAHHNEHPEMRAREISERVIATIEEGAMDFILVNFANADMIAHTGDFAAAVKALEVLDTEIARIASAALTRGVTTIITSDHGNVERMMDPITGIPETKHNASEVHFYLVGSEWERSLEERRRWRAEERLSVIGLLSDVAPTILQILGIKKPDNMTGESLVSRIN